MKRRTMTRVAVCLALLGAPAIGSANSVTSGSGGSGGNCERESAPEDVLERHRVNAHDMALGLLDFLEGNARMAAIVSRAGSDLSAYRFRGPKRQKYTHAGFAWKSLRDGRWRFKHTLNVCAGPSSQLFVQSLVQFFDDEPHFYDLRVAVPSPGLQERIVKVLEDEAASRRLHIPKYSNIANPFRAEYQNSNGWVLAVIASAQSGRRTYREVLSHYRKAGYVPSRVKLGLLKKLGAGFIANATTRDHPPRLFGGWYRFVSAASLERYLADTDRPLRRTEICHPRGCDIPVATLNGAGDPG